MASAGRSPKEENNKGAIGTCVTGANDHPNSPDVPGVVSPNMQHTDQKKIDDVVSDPYCYGK